MKQIINLLFTIILVWKPQFFYSHEPKIVIAHQIALDYSRNYYHISPALSPYYYQSSKSIFSLPIHFPSSPHTSIVFSDSSILNAQRSLLSSPVESPNPDNSRSSQNCPYPHSPTLLLHFNLSTKPNTISNCHGLSSQISIPTTSHRKSLDSSQTQKPHFFVPLLKH